MTDASDVILDEQAQLRQLRVRKVYIQLRIPKLRSELKQLLEQKKGLESPDQEKSRSIAEQKIYTNQHLIALRAELNKLSDEQKTVLEQLRKLPVTGASGEPAPAPPI